MTDQEYESLSDDQLVARLDNADMMERFLKSDDWKLFREAFRRIYLEADEKLNTVDPGDYKKIAELQVLKKFYRNVLEMTIHWYKVDGQAAFEEAKDRGMLKRLSSLVLRSK